MDSTILSAVASAYVQDQMEQATAARRVREAQAAQPRTPRLQALRRHLSRRVPAEAAAPIGTLAHR